MNKRLLAAALCVVLMFMLLPAGVMAGGADVLEISTPLSLIHIYGDENLWLTTTKAPKSYVDCDWSGDVTLMFGKETAGLPEWLREKYRDKCIRIPMISEARSLNLSNAAAILTYEALRQQGFKGLKDYGIMKQEESV